MKIYESAEDYLESILILKERRGVVRSIDIVNELGYSKPSVSIAMKKLRENGYISMDVDGSITLKESGQKIADDQDEIDYDFWASRLLPLLHPDNPRDIYARAVAKI